MRRKLLLSGSILFLGLAAYSQTLFTYGKHAVDKAEFLKAFRKNNTDPHPDAKAYEDYLQLYIRFRLKVQEALAQRMDTLPNQVAELHGFREQMADQYMNDEGTVNALVQEAAERSQRDIHIAHILIKVPAHATEADWEHARKKATAAWQELKQGKPFETVALQYSEDPNVQSNKGDIGFITAFVLPYSLESAAYHTAPGAFSNVFRSDIGYHIVKNLGERKALGKISVAQILLAFPPDADTNTKKQVAQKADSLYQALLHGADFKALAAAFSSDNISYQTGGQLPEFGVGRYAPDFENAAFGIKKDSALASPVATDYGYHIIKRLARIPVPAASDPAFLQTIKDQVMQSDRIALARKALLHKIDSMAPYRPHSFNKSWLWALSDSVLEERKLPAGKDNLATKLFSYGTATYTLADFKSYLEGIRPYSNMTAGKTAAALLEDFRNKKALDYYRQHLEAFNKDFAYQLKEFKEGNLLFEMMQRKIWEPASADSAGLRRYFNDHPNKYFWEASADAIILTCSNEQAANRAREAIKENVLSWKKLLMQGDGSIQGDSGRFELSQIPVVDRTNFTAGLFTAPVRNETDQSISFAYIIRLHPDKEPRSFEDARGFVINDYQGFLEEAWIKDLRKKYPVHVRQSVLKSLYR